MSNRWAVRLILILSVLAWTLVAQPAAMARQPGVPAQAVADPIKIEVQRRGLGDRARPGEWIGIRVEITDSSLKPRDVALCLGVRDADGDTALMQRLVVPTPGQKQSYWLYARLPFWIDSATTLVVTANEIEPPAADGKDQSNVAPLGRELGRQQFAFSTLVPPYNGMIGVIGRNSAQLDLYAVRRNNEWLPTGHELTELLLGLRVSDLPDRWYGYSGLSALVWTGAGTENNPSEITEQSKVQAIKEWVQRGGHLIIVLPGLDPQWSNPKQPLADLLPKVSIDRRENVDLNPYLTLLRPRPPEGQTSNLPTSANLSVFTPDPQAAPGQAICVLQGPDRECVVARRIVGQGAVTLVGFDLTSPALLASGGIHPAVFWNRVLARRGELYTATELDNMLTRQRRGNVDRRDPVVELDSMIGSQINKTGQAAAGVLLAFVVFGLYWLIAGPLGFIALRRNNRSHLAWLGFVAVAAVFTAIAWGGATLIRPSATDANHITILDHVYGQPTQRARAWMNVLLPRYGRMNLSIPRDKDLPELTNLIAPWDSPADQGALANFPDAKAYNVEARRPDSMTVPTRATVKSVQIDWAGASRWKMPLPMPITDDPGAPSVIRVVERSVGEVGPTAWGLEGRLKNELPGDLTDVNVIIVRQQASLGRGNTDALLFSAEGFAISRWGKGKIIDLSEITKPEANRARGTSISEYMRVSYPSSQSYDQRRQLSPSEIPQRLAQLTFFPLLEPPRWNDSEADPLFRRVATHGWDLARWFSQPCVIIIGDLGSKEEPMPSPVPLMVDGSEVSTGGRTLVRWVYPLPDNPPVVPLESEQSDTETKKPAEKAAPSLELSQPAGTANPPGSKRPSRPGSP